MVIGIGTVDHDSPLTIRLFSWDHGRFAIVYDLFPRSIA
jgi:hypothetical protein